MIDFYADRGILHFTVKVPPTELTTEIPCTLENLQKIDEILRQELEYIQRILKSFMPVDIEWTKLGISHDK